MRRSGNWVTGEYFVISSGGPRAIDVESQITHLGPPDDVAACREWLRALPGRA
jgi:hypothetical protein